MKFSSTLQFNAVPEWRDHYIDYDGLKELIFRLERANLPSAYDSDSLAEADAVKTFCKAVDVEVLNVDAFFCEIEHAIFSENDVLDQKLHGYLGALRYSDRRRYSDAPRHADAAASVTARSWGRTRSNSTTAATTTTTNSTPNNKHSTTIAAANAAAAASAIGSDSSDDEAGPLLRRKSAVHAELVQKRSIPFENVSLRREVTRVYVQLHELLSYIDLNRDGVRKALKKFDKVTGSKLLPEYMAQLGTVHVFSEQTSTEIGVRVDSLVSYFAKLVNEPESKAAETLSGLLREQIVYERNTVWRELIGLERQAQGVQGENSGLQGGQGHKRSKQCQLLSGLPVSVEGARSLFYLVLAVILFFVVLVVQPLASLGQTRCLAIVVLASVLWATEALPLFVTSLLVPVLVVVLHVPLDESGLPMDAHDASAFVFAKMWLPVISVLLGGFALAAALSKYNMAKVLAQYILKRVGTNSPQMVILTMMLVGAFLCMSISNVAAPVLLFSVAQPLLRLLPPGDPFNKALILGIALASNVGGMVSPIASPQNILALQNMNPEPSWIEWFIVATPVSILSIVLIWVWLCLTLRITPEAREVLSHSRLAPGASTGAHFTLVHFYILAVTFVTISLWCFSHQLEPVFGDMGVLAFVPIVLLFGTGVLTAADFNNFLWTIVALAMGGIVLGKSVESCGLLATIAGAIQTKVSGLPLFAICLTFGLMILVVASFISHTVAALIVLPLVKSIGEQLDDSRPRLVVMISTLLCSGAMALPTSGFPNVTAVCMVDEFGKPYLTAVDFISRGIPASLLVYLVVVTVGYMLCSFVGF